MEARPPFVARPLPFPFAASLSSAAACLLAAAASLLAVAAALFASKASCSFATASRSFSAASTCFSAAVERLFGADLVFGPGFFAVEDFPPLAPFVVLVIVFGVVLLFDFLGVLAVLVAVLVVAGALFLGLLLGFFGFIFARSSLISLGAAPGRFPVFERVSTILV